MEITLKNENRNAKSSSSTSARYLPKEYKNNTNKNKSYFHSRNLHSCQVIEPTELPDRQWDKETKIDTQVILLSCLKSGTIFWEQNKWT